MMSNYVYIYIYYVLYLKQHSIRPIRPLVYVKIDLENGSLEVDLTIPNSVIFHSKLLVYQRVSEVLRNNSGTRSE